MTLHCTSKSPKILVLLISKIIEIFFFFFPWNIFFVKCLMGPNDKIFQWSSLRPKFFEKFILYRYCKYCFSIFSLPTFYCNIMSIGDVNSYTNLNKEPKPKPKYFILCFPWLFLPVCCLSNCYCFFLKSQHKEKG